MEFSKCIFLNKFKKKKKIFKLYDRKYKLQNFPLKSTEAENAEKFT